ncbi:hypothetical protein Goshw_017029, partial [Gossypium schwendimanii]|nr:hypothetical protein [Gossypium schwendimanii]
SAFEVEDAGEAFSKQLNIGHKVSCPWRGNSCPESLVQFPPTPQSALIAGYKDRCDGLVQFQSLPINYVSEFESRSESVPELDVTRDGAFCLYSRVRYFNVFLSVG